MGEPNEGVVGGGGVLAQGGVQANKRITACSRPGDKPIPGRDYIGPFTPPPPNTGIHTGSHMSLCTIFVRICPHEFP